MPRPYVDAVPIIVTLVFFWWIRSLTHSDLTHATLNFSENKGKAPVLLSMIDKTLAQGVDITLDTYPYLPGCTTLAALLPSWASAGGPSETLQRLEDAGTREKIRVAVEVTGCDGGHGIPTNWDEIQVGVTLLAMSLLFAQLIISSHRLAARAIRLCCPTLAAE